MDEEKSESMVTGEVLSPEETKEAQNIVLRLVSLLFRVFAFFSKDR